MSIFDKEIIHSEFALYQYETWPSVFTFPLST